MILILLSDTPPKNGSTKSIEFLQKILDTKLTNTKIIRVSDNPLDENLSKTKVLKLAQPILDLIEQEHPQLILTMGLQALQALGFEGTSVSSICSTPQKGFPFSGGPKIDKRTTRARTQNPITFTDRGYYADRYIQLTLVSHTDILVYPTYSFVNLLSYACGYKGQPFFERQLDRIVEILDEYPNWKPFDDQYYAKLVTLYYKPEDIEEAIKKLAELSKLEYFAFDIETAGYEVPREAQLEYTHPQAEITMISIGTGKHSYVFNTHHLPDLIPYINQCLANKGKHLTWNGKFDIEFCMGLWNTKFDGHTHIDGMTCLYLADLNMQFLGKGSTRLKFACAVFPKNGAKMAGYQKNAGIDEAIVSGDGRYLAEHEIEFMRYCGIDVCATYSTTALLYNMLSKKTQTLATTFYPNLNATLNQIHHHGIRVDVPKMEQYIKDLEYFLKDIEAHIEKLYPGMNVRSTEECAEIMYNKRGIPPVRTEKGNYSVTSEILDKYPDDEFCKLVSDHRSFEKQLQIIKVVKKHLVKDHCYTFYDIYRTTSGRLSAKNPPIHIIPKNKKIYTKTPIPADQPKPVDLEKYLFRAPWGSCKVEPTVGSTKVWQIIEKSPNFKDIFIPDYGYTLLYGDYSQLEIVILANLIEHLSEDKTLQNAIISGADLHSYTASLLYSVLKKTEYTADFIYQQAKVLEVEPYVTWRSYSKAVIFKLIYGGTYKSLSEEWGISLEEAQEIWATFLRVIPGIVDYSRSAIANARINKYAESWGGHTRDLWVYKFEDYNNKAKNIALNHPIQSTASYLVLEALVELHRRLPEIDPNARILLTVHDSIAVQVPTDKMQQGLTLMKECMVDYLMKRFSDFLVVPLKVSFEYGTSWHNLQKAS